MLVLASILFRILENGVLAGSHLFKRPSAIYWHSAIQGRENEQPATSYLIHSLDKRNH